QEANELGVRVEPRPALCCHPTDTAGRPYDAVLKIEFSPVLDRTHHGRCKRFTVAWVDAIEICLIGPAKLIWTEAMGGQQSIRKGDLACHDIPVPVADTGGLNGKCQAFVAIAERLPSDSTIDRLRSGG